MTFSYKIRMLSSRIFEPKVTPLGFVGLKMTKLAFRISPIIRHSVPGAYGTVLRLVCQGHHQTAVERFCLQVEMLMDGHGYALT